MLVLLAWFAAAELDQAAPMPQPAPSASKAMKASGAAPPEIDELVVTPPQEAREPDWSSRLNFDVRRVYSPLDAPYLRQRPTSGCKLMAGGATSLIDEPGAAGGMVCAKRF